MRELGWRSLIDDDQADKHVRQARKRKEAGEDRAEEREGEDEQAMQLPPIENGENGTVKESSALTRQTKPPAYFTQASLLDAMVNIDLYIADPRAKAVLGGSSANQKRGIGTGATRANIIKTVFDRGYVEERGTAIHTTARCSAFVVLARRLVPWMVNPIHSVEQEAALQAIEAGQGCDESYVSEVIQRTHATLQKLKAARDSTRIEDAPVRPARGRLASYGGKGAPKGRRRGSSPGPAAPDETARRIYFSVPYEKREEARSAGLRWDGDAGKWYAPSVEIAERIKQARQAAGTGSLPPKQDTGKPTPATGSRASDQADTERVYFNVAFAEKDKAKAFGMRFDGKRKQWFAPTQDIAKSAGGVFRLAPPR